LKRQSAEANLVYVLPDKMGGIATMVANLLAYRRSNDGLRYGAVLTYNSLSADTRFGELLAADQQVTVEYALPLENLYSVLRRLARAIPSGPGVLVSNDWIELAMLAVHDTERTVIQILHGDYDYYYDLALKHEGLIHAFVTGGRVIYDKLRACLPHRSESMFHLPYGVPIATRARKCGSSERLRLLFAGRLEHQKGIFDLPRIDDLLRELNVPVEWTVVGGGPQEQELRRRWGGSGRVRWLGRCSNAAVQALYADHDVFVLPSRFEGFPVGLLEAMGSGLVPVVSDIRSGIAEIMEPGVTGYLAAVGDIVGFASAIKELDDDRERLETMSCAARRRVVERFNIQERVTGYQALFNRWRELYRPRPRHVQLHYGSRLDQSWLPNGLVWACRATRRRLVG
jgi:glycosyltransferase involved in cell wall biosynthesis